VIRLILILLALCTLFSGCVNTPTETENTTGEELKVIITTKTAAIYTIAPNNEIRFHRISTEMTNDTTEIRTVLYLHRNNKDSVSVSISKDSKRLFGRIQNSANTILKEFIMDNGAETRIVKF